MLHRNGTANRTYLPDPENFPDHSPSGLLRGRVTAVKVWVLEKDPDMPEGLWTVTFYDKYGREIQTQADNHLQNKDITWQEYNFAGELLLSKHAHTGYFFDQPPGPDFDPYERSATIYKSYTYDSRGRLLRVEQKTEDPDNPGHETEYTTLSEHRYDVLGQMTGKNLGYESGTQFLQIGDYQYNIRGWLSKFNQPSTATSGGTYRDLLAFELHYNTGASAIVSGTPNLFNGNIAAMQWQVLGEGKEIRAFAFTYDQMNRLTSAKYREKTSSSWNVNSGRYDVTNLVYDRNGNIKSLQRKGMTNPVAEPPGYGVMDNLSYTYENSGKSNRLQRINDAGVKTVMAGVEHFVDGNTSNTDYLYDNSGNLKQDLNKGISSIVYNHLNKPTTITFSNGKKIQYIYDAAGQKLRQKVFGNGGSLTTVETDYVGPFHYEDADGNGSSATLAIPFFAHEEGRVRRTGEELVYEWFLKDHLGNVRVMFADMDGNGAVSPDPVNGEVLQVDHFYPFGLRMAGLSLVPAVKNSYLFTGKETQDELSLGWIDFGARMYDAAAGRWNGVDALAERYLSHSPYVYTFNNPIVFVDPDGRETTTAQLIANAWAATPEGGSATFSFGNANSSEQENTEEKNPEGMGNDFSVGMTNPEKSEIGEDLGNKELQMKHNRNGQKTNSLAAWPPLKFIRYYQGVRIYEADIKGAVTIPPVGIIVPKGQSHNVDLIRHEYGHFIQFMVYKSGVYYNMIATTSLLSALLDQLGGTNHRNTWTEKDANQWSYWLHGRPNNWNFQSFPVYVK